MTKVFCDICGKEIKDNDEFSQYKIKKLEYCWYESSWSELVVHNKCWKTLCNRIRDELDV